MMRTTISRLCVIASLAVIPSLGYASEPIRIRVSPAVAFSPADIMIETTVEPDARNREVEVTVDSAGFLSTSTVTLDGDNAPRVKTFRFRQLPAGNYEVSAT